MTFKSLHATAALRPGISESAWSAKLPHLDRLVKTATDQIFPVRRECHAVNTVFVAIWSLEAFEQIALVDVPDTNALIQRASSDILSVGRDGDSCHAVFYRERERVAPSLDVPQANSSVAATRGDSTAIPSEVQRVDVLFVTRECVTDGSGLDIPDLSRSVSMIRD